MTNRGTSGYGGGCDMVPGQAPAEINKGHPAGSAGENIPPTPATPKGNPMVGGAGLDKVEN